MPINDVLSPMRGRAYTCADCGEPVRGAEIADLTATERAALREGNYLCAACKEKRQMTNI